MSTSRNSSRERAAVGRRRNYEQTIEEVGLQRFVPRGWANVTGVVMFGVLAIVVAGECVRAIAESRGADPAAAGIVAVLLGWMAFTFATTRVKD
ncbi:MAG: hypothetical protein HYX33_00780 [Actinobacteria bacterium]|nr:hypothetical protein [Actinomycetota bacterium]